MCGNTDGPRKKRWQNGASFCIEKENTFRRSSQNERQQKENHRIAMKLNTVYIMKHVEIPISIVECGFLSNPEEEQQLQQEEYQNRLAWGIYNGIITYFSNHT